MKTILFALVFALVPLTASAQLFRIRATDYGAGNGNAVFRAYVDSELAKIQADINKDLPSGQPNRLMEGMANSSAMAGKGIGTDYASNMDVFLVGAGVGVGADLHKDSTTKSDLSGAAVAPGVVVGMNLAWMDARRFMGMDTDRLNLYFNFMKYNYDRQVSDKPDQKSSAELDMMALGVHMRYDWIKGAGNKFLGWGGVKFTFGYEYNKNDITFRSTIKKDASDIPSSGGETYSGTIDGKPVATINTATHSIPLALSTDVQLFYFVSLYTGVGVDYNWGQAKGKGNLNSNDSTITCTGGAVCGGGTSITVRSEANIDASGKATNWTSRAFAGVQFNLPFFRVFVQADKQLGTDVLGATVGARFIY